MEVGQEEMKSLGFFGICREARRIIFSRRKILNQITLAFILPLSLISLIHSELFHYLFANIISNQKNLVETQIDTPKHNKISQYAALFLLSAAYVLLSLVFSLLSTSSIAYTIACMYSGREVTFSEVLRGVPKAWKRLIVTSLTIFAVFFAYSIAAGLLLRPCLTSVGTSNTGFLILLFIVVAFYLGGLIYMSIVWQLANTVSMLENSYGFEAMKRSHQLIKGKVGVTVSIYFVLGFFHIMVQVAFQKLVVHGERQDMISWGLSSITYVCIDALLVRYGYVFQTVIYFVCKSYHNEEIDMLALLSDDHHLEACYDHQEYVSLKGEKDVEPGKLMV